MAEVKESTARPLAYVGIVLGILSLIILAIVFGTLAIIIGAIALTRAGKKERVLCYVAIALGTIGLVLWAAMLLVLFGT
jgi:hypothetical protein